MHTRRDGRAKHFVGRTERTERTKRTERTEHTVEAPRANQRNSAHPPLEKATHGHY
jgi:hypothetical protein